jgi:predicted GIY-YIG superfamily endonuclease
VRQELFDPDSKRFLYTIRRGNRVVYVGVTADVRVRLNSHRCSTKSEVGRYIQECKLKGIRLTCVIECEVRYADCLEAERKMIEHYYRLNRSLLNVRKRPQGNGKSIPVFMDKESRVKRFDEAIKRSKLREVAS